MPKIATRALHFSKQCSALSEHCPVSLLLVHYTMSNYLYWQPGSWSLTRASERLFTSCMPLRIRDFQHMQEQSARCMRRRRDHGLGETPSLACRSFPGASVRHQNNFEDETWLQSFCYFPGRKPSSACKSLSLLMLHQCLEASCTRSAYSPAVIGLYKKYFPLRGYQKIQGCPNFCNLLTD